MNQEKIGLFIKELREEKKLTQDELAKKVHRGRDAISKWERGKNLPDMETLLTLSKIFDVSMNEILAGEKNAKINVTLELYDNQYSLKKKLRRITFTMLFILFLGISCSLVYFFIAQHKFIHTYTVTGNTDDFEIMNGLFVKTNYKQYFSLGNIVSKESITIDKITLYYIEDNQEELICSRNSGEMMLIDYVGYEEYFQMKNIDTILNNLYLKINYDKDSVDTIKLSLKVDYVNNNLYLKKIKNK